MSEPTTINGRALLLRSRNPTDQLHISREALVPAVVAIESEAAAAERSRLEEHWPEIDGDVDDSTWLACSCGWNALNSKVSWWEHIPAVEPLSTQLSQRPE